jgi:hypothetical protein
MELPRPPNGPRSRGVPSGGKKIGVASQSEIAAFTPIAMISDHRFSFYFPA